MDGVAIHFDRLRLRAPLVARLRAVALGKRGLRTRGVAVLRTTLPMARRTARRLIPLTAAMALAIPAATPTLPLPTLTPAIAAALFLRRTLRLLLVTRQLRCRHGGPGFKARHGPGGDVLL